METGPQEKHAGGRPLKFKTVEELETKIEEYFKSCWTKQVLRGEKGKPILDEEGKPQVVEVQYKPYTVSGLAYALDVDRKTLLNYSDREEFFHTVTRAKKKIEAYAEESLWTPKIATGVMFSMKNNYGWKDKTETDITSGGEKIGDKDIDVQEIADSVAAALRDKKTNGS